MRISGGEARNRLIRIPAGGLIRPTTDRVREALFDILPTVAGNSFLDLYAGSGIVGLEALSRGASLLVLVEKDFRAVKVLKENIHSFGFTAKAEILCAPVQRAVGLLCASKASFDIIFADPPYNRGLAAEIVHLLEDGELMAPTGVFILQHSVRELTEELRTKFIVHEEGSIFLSDQRRYGETILSFFRKTDSVDGSAGIK